MVHVCMVYVCCMYGISLYDTSGFYERKKVQDQITGFTYTLVKQNQKKRDPQGRHQRVNKQLPIETRRVTKTINVLS